MKTRIVCYCNTNSVFTSNILLNSLIQNSDEDIEIVSVIETGKIIVKPNTYARLRRIISLLKNLKIINRQIINDLSIFIKQVAKRNNINYNVPTDFNINSESHRNYINGLLFPNTKLIAIIFGCPQIFKKELLGMFDFTINYHDSYLPYFRGLNATAWSRFENKAYSGYTFHLVTRKIDDGEVVFQELLPFNSNWNIHQHLYHKTLSASAKINKVISFIRNGEIEPRSTETYSSKHIYYSEKMKEEMINTFERYGIHNKKNIANFEKAFGISIREIK